MLKEKNWKYFRFSALVHVSEALGGIGQAVGRLECTHVFKLLLLECGVLLAVHFPFGISFTHEFFSAL